MQNDEAASQAPTPFRGTSRSGGCDTTTGPRADMDDPLLDLLERWEERFRRDEDPAPESLGIDDPELLKALRERIERQKRLYDFMKHEPAGDAGGSEDIPMRAGARRPPQGRAAHDEAPETSGSKTAPTSIGRYRLIRILGEGGFGRVHLAHDAELDRDVAIKVPIHFPASPFLDVESYLEEARIIARLSHPNIVPVYDVGRTKDGRCYVVSKHMEGGDLAARLRHGRLAFAEAAELVAVLCEALHYTHTHDLFHRDIKPANILLDGAGIPSLADFGLALKDENLGKGAHHVGTAAYMSPEQARGEGHRVDGRSDIFSIGIVLYELLTGRRPFRGGSKEEVMKQIVHAEPRPPRQIDDTIPRELERICLRALAKRASERYSTARDLAEDLRLFHKTASCVLATEVMSPTPVPVPATTATTPTPVPGSSDSGGRPIRIVPKGLGSFDEDDADFFLELLPGPRDRDGLPDGLRFWKTRVETTDPDRAFRVGLIYGPSGCGKSSLVKAGLLPLLGPHVDAVYVEATASETEPRLQRGIRKRFPALPADSGLVESLATLRRGQGLMPGRKVLVVLDQFEQWLFARRGVQGSELVAALRQCDGEHLQALCMVRDDFWMAATRFMRDLEIDLVPDRNVAVVDLFDPRHARKVLTAYGRAFEALPPRAGDLTKEQNFFLDQAVAGLAQDGCVVPVRLALFAEMVKRKPWTPATLREVGGMDGVGVTFLEETFSSPRSSPNHRYRQKAAQAVLKALLPESNADIKGLMRSVEELRVLSGYTDRPPDFVDLIRTLDTDLRLITPVDPEGSIDEDAPALPVDGLYYQLTHDYLVHALREWLTRKQRETRRGRAELLLAERAALWNAKPLDRYLPSIREWAHIRILTKPKGWTELHGRMMRSATRYHTIRGALFAIVLTGATVAGLGIMSKVDERQRASRAANLVSQLLVADIDQVPRILKAIDGASDLTYPELSLIAGDRGRPHGERLRAALALLPSDQAQLDCILDRLLVATPEEVLAISDRLKLVREQVVDRLWKLAGLRDAEPKQRFRAACTLAVLDPESGRWTQLADAVADGLVKEGPLPLKKFAEVLRPVREPLLNPLATIFRDASRAQIERSIAVTVLVEYAADRANLLAELIQEADPLAFNQILPALERQRDQAVAVLRRSLDQAAIPDWKDPAPDPAWVLPVASLVDQIEQAQGLLCDRFAICQTVALDQFASLAEGLRKSGYRPVRIRPFAASGSTRVAAIWTRDGRPWELSLDTRAADLNQQDRRWRDRGYGLVDIAGYSPAVGTDLTEDVVYAVVWAKNDPPESAREVRLFAGVTDSAIMGDQAMRQEGLRCISLHRWIGRDGMPRYDCLYQKSTDPVTVDFQGDSLGFEAKLTSNGPPVDVSLGPAPPPSLTRAELRSRVDQAQASLRLGPDYAQARLAEADALYRLHRYEELAAEMSAWIATSPKEPQAYYFRALARARLGAAEMASADAAQFSKLTNEPSSISTFLETMVAIYSGRGPEGLQRLEASLSEHATHAKCLYLYSRAYAVAARTAGQERAARVYADHAIALLRDAITQGFDDYSSIRTDSDPESPWDHPGLRQLLGPPGLELRYAVIWRVATDRESKGRRAESGPGDRGRAQVQAMDRESKESHGLAPEAHRAVCRELAAQGYRPVAIAVIQPKADSPLVAASVWQRPALPETVQDNLPRRTSRAAVALARLGRSERVWPLLKQTPDASLRTYLIHDLGPLGIDHRSVVGRLDVERDVTARRALLLALGEFPEARFSSEARRALAPTIEAIYRDDPDAGMHGCARWLLRSWGGDEHVRRIDAELAGESPRRERDWYINAEKLTFTIIRGPVEYMMGSPPSEPHHQTHEAMHRVRIERSFAVATTEVTAGLYDRFLHDNPEFRREDIPAHRSGPEDPIANVNAQGPIANVDVYHAAAFCRWLSEREGVIEDQQCYPPIPKILQGEREGRMSLLPGYLNRTGYRLPTEAEWEYVCRSGSQASRHYGRTASMLPHYGWSTMSSGERTHPVGELKPNDLGLFDMLGNVWEWCQDDGGSYRPSFSGRPVLDKDELAAISERTPLVFRGGSCYYTAQLTRSAARIGFPPTTRQDSVGFRVVRTIR
jgi:eukaryotic-like serine/threonine-protein kinase